MSTVNAGEVVWIKCRLARGLYSHDRTYFIKAPGGGEYQGAVQIHFCRDSRGNPLPDKHPTGDTTGTVKALVVRPESNGVLTVAIPGDQNIVISSDLIAEAGGAYRVSSRS
jgi:hypothetical protein